MIIYNEIMFKKITYVVHKPKVFYRIQQVLVLKKTRRTPLSMILLAMEDQLRMIPKHVSHDAQLLMVAATLHSGRMRGLAIFQVLDLRANGMNGRQFQGQKIVKLVRFLLIIGKSNGNNFVIKNHSM